MSTDDLTEALRIAGQCRGFADPSRNERAIIALADEVDRLRAEADRWKARSVTAGIDLDAARAALERVKAVERKEAWGWFMTILNDHYLTGQPVHDQALETYEDLFGRAWTP